MLSIPFVSVVDYLTLLKRVGKTLGKAGPRGKSNTFYEWFIPHIVKHCSSRDFLSPDRYTGMFYLAAAVSDFYVPPAEQVQHKIQSSSGNLMLQLKQVPKLLRDLRMEWAKDSFVVSFKLETDPVLFYSLLPLVSLQF